MTLSDYEIAGGTAAGRAHALAGRNNQDAFHWRARGPYLAAAVCDGCSGAPRSELGALLGARLTAETLVRGLEAGGDPADPLFWEQARAALLDELRRLTSALGEGALHDSFLFTVLGAVIGPRGAGLVSLGDGVVAWNREVLPLGPFPGNEPPYLAYGLGDARVRFTLHRSGPVDQLLLGSDGVADLGPLDEFWTDDRYFRNPDRVRRRLALAARAGTLTDDATLIVIRRRTP